ncbi:hypothetical protein [Cobetia marina]|uniref:hypothetical protein n=1 Tax=Cobetia marina TaxID=28258 RepID=UPI0011725E03|nr:hypothetical protein [Cobetia marina]GED41473.1 hypothetical protein HHA02_08020 [Cobetia marina]
MHERCYRLIKGKEEYLVLEVKGEDNDFISVNDARYGKPNDPEGQRIAEIIDRLNEFYGAEVSDDGNLHFANGIADRIERDEAVMAQARNHSED